MVFVNNQKFACESCIKGHRSSSCHHTDRPLFEVKKKGRPVSQCETCREARKLKKVHSKCICDNNVTKTSRVETRPLTTKYRRHIPVHPTLPNGLKDFLETDSVAVMNDGPSTAGKSRSGCACGGKQCKCAKPAALTPSPSNGSQPRPSCCSSKKAFSENKPSAACSSASSSSSSCCTGERATVGFGAKRTSCCSGVQKPKRKRHHSPGPELPPLLLPEQTEIQYTGGPTSIEPPPPTAMPPISTIASLAGSGCNCGIKCACPGCKEHRGAERATQSGVHDCSEGLCATCVTSQVALPDYGTFGHGSGGGQQTSHILEPNALDAFFKRAASLPAPPDNWKYGIPGNVDSLNPFDVSIYPTYTIPTHTIGHLGKAKDGLFQLVNLPKLECCGGNCGCPAGQCSCGQSCDGCCDHHLKESRRGRAGSASKSLENGPVHKPSPQSHKKAVPVLGMQVRQIRKGGCCS